MNGFKFTGDRYGFCKALRESDKRRAAVCAVCGEAAGSTGSMTGLVHKWGPTDHEFTTRAPVPAGAMRMSSLTAAGRKHFLGEGGAT